MNNDFTSLLVKAFNISGKTKMLASNLGGYIKQVDAEFTYQKYGKTKLIDLLEGEAIIKISRDPGNQHPSIELLDLSEYKQKNNGLESELDEVFIKLPNHDLYDFAYLPPERFIELGKLAISEDWGGGNLPLLRNYIKYTFHRLFYEEKIFFSQDEQFAVINTGLVDPRYQSIYAYFSRNKLKIQPWRLEQFCVAAEGFHGKNLVKSFHFLPDPANYMINPVDIIFNVNAPPPQIDWRHVIVDNVDRLPVDFLIQAASGFEIKQCKTMDKDELFEYKNSFEDYLSKNDFKHRSIMGMLEFALKTTLTRVRWNYKTAIPIYYPKHNKISLLLPLCLINENVVDVALVVERTDSGNYQGQTIYPIDWAYTHARLIARPESDWLTSEYQAGDIDA